MAITKPAEGNGLSDTITIAADVQDQSNIQRVDFFVGDDLIDSVLDSPYEISWDTNTVENGLYTISVSALDQFGNEGSDAKDYVVFNLADDPKP